MKEAAGLQPDFPESEILYEIPIPLRRRSFASA